MARRAGLAAANSRDAEPQREKSYELARDNQRAGNNHERREHIQKSPFAFPSRFWDPIATDIRANPMSSGQSQQKQRFPMAPLERCDSDVSMFGFSALADKSHGAACRYAQIHYAGHCRQQPYERLAVEIDDIRIHGSRVHFKNRIRCESQRRTHEEQYPNDGQPQDGYCSAFPMLFFENIKRVQEATAINAPAQYNSPGNSLRMIPSLLQLQVIWLIDVLDGSRLYGVLRLPYLTWQSNCSFIIFEAVG